MQIAELKNQLESRSIDSRMKSLRSTIDVDMMDRVKGNKGNEGEDVYVGVSRVEIRENGGKSRERMSGSGDGRRGMSGRKREQEEEEEEGVDEDEEEHEREEGRSGADSSHSSSNLRVSDYNKSVQAIHRGKNTLHSDVSIKSSSNSSAAMKVSVFSFDGCIK